MNPEICKLIQQRDALLGALEQALEWIDAVPKDTVLPSMPGFLRDEVDELIHDVKVKK